MPLANQQQLQVIGREDTIGSRLLFQGLHNPRQVSWMSVVITIALQQMAAMYLWGGG